MFYFIMANNTVIKENRTRVGDKVKIRYTFKEGDKEKKQIFEGIILKISGVGSNKTFTVRKMTKSKIGVERIFPIASPFIDSFEVVTASKQTKAKLYYIRNRSEREIRERIHA